MRHPTEGVLRRLLDEPAGVADADRRHVSDCPECLTALAAVRGDADLVAAALASGPAPDVDVAAGWQRLSRAASAAEPARATAPPRRESRVRKVLRRPATAALAVAVVLTGAGTAAANDWLPIFRAERVAPLSFSTQDLLSLPDLSAYGELELSEEPAVRSVPDATAAGAQTGLDVPEVADLPAGVSGEPIYQVVQEVSATFTFSPERAAEAAAASGEPLPPPPDGLEGSSVRLDVGPGLAQIWTSTSGAPALLVARTQAPTAFASGLPFETVRDYLLSLPGLPDDVAEQLRTFAADGSTLPVPVPSEYATTTTAEVDGEQATVLESRDGVLAAVIWVDDGQVTIVAGALDADEVVSIARELQ